MAINRNAWGLDERIEYEQMLEVVVSTSSTTGDRLDMFEKELNDAVQAHRPWARDVERAALRLGLAKEIKNYQDRQRALVSHDGKVLNLPSVQGRRMIGGDGQVIYQRELIELWTWGQIVQKRKEALHGQMTYNSKVAHYDALLSLRDMAPGSTSPYEAAKMLETTVEQWLGGKVSV